MMKRRRQSYLTMSEDANSIIEGKETRISWANERQTMILDGSRQSIRRANVALGLPIDSKTYLFLSTASCLFPFPFRLNPSRTQKTPRQLKHKLQQT
jgi:hypothetical protein